MPSFLYIFYLQGKGDGGMYKKKKKRKENILCTEKVSGECFPSDYQVYHTPTYKSKEAVTLMKYNSQLISVEHRRSIPHQK